MDMTFIADALRWALAGAAHTLPSAFRAFSQAAAPMAVTALWQSAAVAAGLAICLRFAPRASAAHRFAVWAAGFAAVLALPFLPLLLTFGSHAAGGAAASLAVAPPKPWLQLDIHWSLGLGALWIAASLLRAVDLGLHSLRLRRLWRAAIPVVSGDLADALPPASAAQWGRRTVQVCTTRDLDRPSVIGFWAPRILIPDWLLPRLTREELEQVVLHETEHLRRRDDWTNLFQKLFLILFPLNPALIWIERRLCREREMACDDGVVRRTRAPRAYAACLASLAERGLERRAEALSLGAWQRRPELAHRIHRILKRTPSLSPWATNVLLATLGCGLVFGSVEFASCPQLVAFVPAQSAAATQRATSAEALAEAQKQPIHKLSDDSGQIAQPKIIGHAAQFLPAKSRALSPAHRSVASNTRVAAPRAPARAASVQRWETASITPGASRPGRELLNAASAAPRLVVSAAQLPVHTQEWIVLATWQQVQASTLADAESARQGAYASVRRPGIGAIVRPHGEPMTRTSVTRMIFRVYPAIPLSASAAAVPFRNGWLVIQL